MEKGIPCGLFCRQVVFSQSSWRRGRVVALELYLNFLRYCQKLSNRLLQVTLGSFPECKCSKLLKTLTRQLNLIQINQKLTQFSLESTLYNRTPYLTETPGNSAVKSIHKEFSSLRVSSTNSQGGAGAFVPLHRPRPEKRKTKIYFSSFVSDCSRTHKNVDSK